MSNAPATRDASLDLLEALDQIDSSELTFVQLQRLKTALEKALALVAVESDKRSAVDDGGDTTIQVLVNED